MTTGKVNVHRSQQGDFVVNGLKPARFTPDDTLSRSNEREERELQQFLSPELDILVAEILREVEIDRWNGKLKPFVEGEAIGAYPRLVPRGRKRAVGTGRISCRHPDHVQKEQEREAMLALRAKNDATLASLLKRR